MYTKHIIKLLTLHKKYANIIFIFSLSHFLVFFSNYITAAAVFLYNGRNCFINDNSNLSDIIYRKI